MSNEHPRVAAQARCEFPALFVLVKCSWICHLVKQPLQASTIVISYSSHCLIMQIWNVWKSTNFGTWRDGYGKLYFVFLGFNFLRFKKKLIFIFNLLSFWIRGGKLPLRKDFIGQYSISWLNHLKCKFWKYSWPLTM